MSSNIEKYKEDLNRLITVKDMGERYGRINPLEYEEWYSESLALLKQILPDRVSDFERYYKVLVASQFKMEASYTELRQQVGIVESAKKRFESSLFDIKQTLQADVFDNELDAATELNKNGFMRCAGAIAGVVLEGHLKQVCQNHNIATTKKKPTINDFNQPLKDNNVIDTAEWRRIQRLGDLRNKCDHPQEDEPTKEEVKELIEGVDKTIKTLF